MKKTLLLSAAAVLLVAGCSSTVKVKDSASYKCGDQIIAVETLNDNSVILKLNGTSHVLNHVVSDSGHKYQNISAGLTYWEKDGDHFLNMNGVPYPMCRELVK